MIFYTEPAKQVPIKGEYDVIVVGSGPAGVGAAISSAREGAKTLLIEYGSDVGGIATLGMMSHWTGATRGGIYDEIIEASHDLEGDWSQKQIINPEKLKTVLLNMLLENGADVKLYTMVCDTIMDGSVIKGVICESKSGREAYMGKVIIDASGDGDTAYKAGAEFVLGREQDNKMQPATLMFKVGGVDYDKAIFLGSFEETYETPKGELQALAKQHIPSPAGHLLVYRTSLPGIVTCNMTNCTDIDGTNSDDLTKATITCRNQMDDIIKYLHEFVPGFENCFIISSASLIGVRETRHFKGEYTLNENDILESKVFDDWIATKSKFNFDVHNISGSGLDETGTQKHFPKIDGYTIPYRSLLPVKIENLLLAGRNISGTHIAHSNYRAMPICANMGQGAGIAAAIAAKNNITPRNVDVKLVQKRLTELGVTP